MPIPKTRAELTDQLHSSFEKLRTELDGGGPRLGSLSCVDDWTVKDLLAVRVWWTEKVVVWIEAGRRRETPITPAEGYRWKETPRLNADLVEAARNKSFRSLRGRLETGFGRVVQLVEELDDEELLEVGTFPWAGKYPIRRWISLNTVRQYTTARALVRRAKRNAKRRVEV